MSESYPFHSDQCLEWEGDRALKAGSIIYQSANVFRYNYHSIGVTDGSVLIEISLNGREWFKDNVRGEITSNELGTVSGKYKFIRIIAVSENSNAHGSHGCN